MKAIAHDGYGPPEDLELREVDKPSIDDRGVLIRVRAAAANPFDWHLMRGEPSDHTPSSSSRGRRAAASAPGVPETTTTRVSASSSSRALASRSPQVSPLPASPTSGDVRPVGRLDHSRRLPGAHAGPILGPRWSRSSSA